jgi:hypothetical protein
MDRQILWPGEQLLLDDQLNIQRNVMIALGYLAQMAIGAGSYADGFAISATSPASLSVAIGQGAMTSVQTIDATAFSDLGSDGNPLVKLGINFEGTTTLSCPAPGTAGQSIVYLIEAAFSETDGGTELLPYYNAANPSQVWMGPSNSASTQYTQRTQRVTLTAKAGAAAPTGTQTAPGPDANNVGLYTVTVAYGQTTITSSNWAVYSGAPFIGAKIGPGVAPLNSPAFTGTPTTTLPTSGDDSYRIPTTSWVWESFAPLASPAFTGAPTAPTVSPTQDSSTKLATTAFVQKSFIQKLPYLFFMNG